MATGLADRKVGARVVTTRLIEVEFQFNGWRSNDGQALQRPRAHCPDPDMGLSVAALLRLRAANFVDFDGVPKAVADATCKMARELLIVDRTAAPAGEGIDSATTGRGEPEQCAVQQNRHAADALACHGSDAGNVRRGD